MSSTPLFNNNEQTYDGQNSEIFDPTGGVDTEAGTDLADAFSEPTVEMPEFEDEQHLDPTMLGLTGEFDDELPTEQSDMQLDETVQMPDAATLDDDLNDFPSNDTGEDLTQQLEEALNLLEGDFDEEFTASQLLERTEAARSLEEIDTDLDTATEIANDIESLADKVDS